MYNTKKTRNHFSSSLQSNISILDTLYSITIMIYSKKFYMEIIFYRLWSFLLWSVSRVLPISSTVSQIPGLRIVPAKVCLHLQRIKVNKGLTLFTLFSGSSIVRHFMQIVWRPIFKKFEVKMPEQCPLHFTRDVFKVGQGHSTK